MSSGKVNGSKTQVEKNEKKPLNGEGNDAEKAEFVVEKILEEKKTKKGKTYFYLKWKGFPDSENSWEPEENLSCPDLINEFRQRRKFPADANDSSAKKKRKTVARPTGTDGSSEPDKIMGATDSNGELTFLMKWKGTEVADLVPARIANVKWPQVVIKFYEQHLTWDKHQLNGRQ